MADYTQFQHISHIGETDILTQLEQNLKLYTDWSMLGIGGWVDIAIDQTGVFTGEDSNLKMIDDDSYTDGQVWEGFRKDWVWETGVDYTTTGVSPEPTTITGVTVNGTSYASGDATYGWHINYALGRVIFDTAIATASTVKLAYSYRYVQSHVAADVPWWRELQYRSFHSEDIMFTQDDNGDWVVGGNHRVQMPCVIIEATSRGAAKGYELGNNALALNLDVNFHIFAENRSDRNKLVATFLLQNDKTIWMANIDDIARSGDFPLDYRGMLTGTKMYPDLVATSGDGGYRWKKMDFMNNAATELVVQHQNLYQGLVRSTCQVIYGSI